VRKINSCPANTLTSISSVERGRWEFVNSAYTMRNSNAVLVTDNFTWWRLIVWLVLLLNLLGKLHYEEKLLLERFRTTRHTSSARSG
jgi:hypothetical protein